MEKQLAELYNKLVNQVLSMIPVEWEDIYFLGEVEKGRSSYSTVFFYTDINKNETIKSNNIPEVYNVSKNIYTDLLMELGDILLEIYDCFGGNGQKQWEQLSLHFNTQGKFEIEFFYDVMNENDGGQLTREVIWAYKTFGLKPEEGTYSRRVLDEYLSKH